MSAAALAPRFAPAIEFTPETALVFIVERNNRTYTRILRDIAEADGAPLPEFVPEMYPDRGLFWGMHDYDDAAALAPYAADNFRRLWGQVHAVAHARMRPGYCMDDGSGDALQYKREIVAAMKGAL